MHGKNHEYDTASGPAVLELRKEDSMYAVADQSGLAVLELSKDDTV